MKIKLALLIFFLFIISINAQIYTPSGTIQGTSTNNNVGIGTDTPATKLDVIGNGRISTALSIGLGTVAGNRMITLTPTTDASMPNIQGLLAGTGAGSFTLQALGGNIGIGSSNAPTGKLDIFTGTTGVPTTIAALPTGMMSFANNGGATAVPTIFSKSSNSIGFSIFAGTNNTNVSQDMRFVVMEEDGTDFATLTSSAFRFARFSTSLVEILRNGNVGIGVANPTASLDINSASIVGAETVLKLKVSDAAQDYIRISNATNSAAQFIPTLNGYHVSDNRASLYLTATTETNMDTGAEPLMIFDSRTTSAAIATRPLFSWDSYGNKKMTLTSNGSLGIGTTTTGTHKLAVEGSIGAREIKVQATGWSDFVFKKNYDLPTLEEVEKHINQKGYLKDIPSEGEVLKNGINLGEMNSKLLQKIEELTLYIIEQSKEIKALKKENESFKTLSERFSKIENQLKNKK